MSIFAEVRLQTAPACRAWITERGCLSAPEWERALSEFSGPRRLTEGLRMRLSEALGVEGVDPLGITRKLLIHESAAPLSRAWLREIGFVHVEAASGLHLYALWRSADFVLERATRAASPRALGVLRALRIAVPLALALGVFALTGFRAGLVRPLMLVGMRWAGSRFGFRWSRATPIFAALTFDAALGFFASFGAERTFGEWAPGELHYALAWWGGILGYEWARARGLGAFRAHAALSLASWLAVLPLDLAAGRFAPATPLLSLLTVEFLVRGGYPALVLGIALPGLAQWLSLFLNRGVGALASVLARAGGARQIPEEWGGVLGVFVALLVFWVSLGVGKAETKGRSGKSSG